MKTFEITFTGRKLGAIGLFYQLKIRIEATDPDAALLKLYETYDHIQKPDIEEITENESN